jgi:nitrogen fixation protein NifU and related proteins
MNQHVAREPELQDLYRELILDHARSPRHFGALPGATHSAAGINPLCGDKLELFLELQADGVIRNISFAGSGCAISMASASLLTETVIGLESSTAIAYFSSIVSRLNGSQDGAPESGIELGKLRALEGVREYPSRVKCATLAWHALRSALNSDNQPVTTE